MRAPNHDQVSLVQALVYKFFDVFDATKDLYQTLTIKEQRDYEETLRSKGYPSSRRIEYVHDEALGSEKGITMDKAAVKRQFEIGYSTLGAEFAIGDASSTPIADPAFANQRLIATFLYGPTSTDSISSQLANVNAASRTAGMATVDILKDLQHRQEGLLPSAPRSIHAQTARPSFTHEPSQPSAASGERSTSTALMKYNPPAPPRSGSPVNTTTLTWRGRPKSERTDTDTTSMTGPTSMGLSSTPNGLFCLYASDLQRHRDQTLASSITSDSVPSCPHCKGSLHLSAGKAWEIIKEDDGFDRCFHVSNRFVVKCHRDGPDGQYACVLCAESGSNHTICGDVKALVKHLWSDHSIRDLKHEEDIVEVIEQPADSRRDSGLGHCTSRSSRRSSLASSRRRKSLPAYEREVDIFDTRSLRRRV
ncbi:hypothetical protein LEMA_P118260.1 [Plenodomus lingam JN3]|uniref:Uncharacterized protein n=1 Tax=Leptosphaeria maculans (strain JN3 / isolate v23.1.3 / race Av1-4-5-6-7-8) TaxID=985895 RepID=E4ZTG7_LEPMJ|nr:hypothetical protein LEMA_P118260.1 [Plenodomus lingam JN3]CBX94823.1 hypothetical protein LEMA_P118260.1 [Plenodomus lingam JN3]